MSSSQQQQLPLRREREGEGTTQQQQSSTSTATTTIPPPGSIDRMDDLFNLLCTSVNQWYREGQEQNTNSDNASSTDAVAAASSNNNNVRPEERKKLLNMLGHFLKETYSTATATTTTSNQQQQQNNIIQQLQPVPDMALTKSLFHLDTLLEKTRNFLRKEMMIRLKKKSKALNAFGGKKSEEEKKLMLLQCKQSSSGTTAQDSSSKKTQQQVNVDAAAAVEEQQTPTFDADAFLFDDEDLDDFEERKWLSRIYCTHCGHCDKLEKTALISHSFSKDGLKYLCTILLQKALDAFLSSSSSSSDDHNDEPFTIVDVGSRLGIVPVATNGYLHRKSKMSMKEFPFKVHGVEIDQDYYQLQKNMFEKTKFVERTFTTATTGAGDNEANPTTTSTTINTIEAHKLDITSEEGKSLLAKANFVIMNNVFEFFTNAEEEELKCWEETVHALVGNNNNDNKKPKFVVMVPPIQESLSSLHEKISSSSNNDNNKKEDLLKRIDELLSFSQAHFEQQNIDQENEMLKIAKYCVGIHDDEEDVNDDDDSDNNNEDEDDHDDCCGEDNCGHKHHHDDKKMSVADKMAEKAEDIEELMEDFAEMTLYRVK